MQSATKKFLISLFYFLLLYTFTIENHKFIYTRNDNAHKSIIIFFSTRARHFVSLKQTKFLSQ